MKLVNKLSLAAAFAFLIGAGSASATLVIGPGAGTYPTIGGPTSGLLVNPLGGTDAFDFLTRVNPVGPAPSNFLTYNTTTAGSNSGSAVVQITNNTGCALTGVDVLYQLGSLNAVTEARIITSSAGATTSLADASSGMASVAGSVAAGATFFLEFRFNSTDSSGLYFANLSDVFISVGDDHLICDPVIPEPLSATTGIAILLGSVASLSRRRKRKTA